MAASRIQMLWREMKPVEHGSWGLFLIPLVLGALVGRGNFAGLGLLALSTLGVFLMRRPALHWLRAFNRESLDSIHTLWPGQAFALCLSMTLLGGIPLLVFGHWVLILVASVAAGLIWSEVYLAAGREQHPFLSELLEVWALSLLAPSAYYVGTGRLDQTAAVLWTLCAIYFSISIADVRVRLARFRVGRGMAGESLIHERRTERLAISWVSLAGALLVTALAPAYRITLFSLVPLLIRPWMRRKSMASAKDISALGWSEVILSLVFAVSAAWFLRQTPVRL